MTLRERLDVYEKLTRLDKPIGILLLMWPTLWGLWLSSYGFPNPGVLVIFLLGVVLMRSAGCVVNDIADRNFDPHVERTRDRPLAAKKVSVAEAAGLSVTLILLAFLLVVQLNRLTVVLSAVALFLALTYPFLKRFFSMPQAYLGIAFGFGIPMAFAAHQNDVVPAAWVVLAANVFWAIAYDTEYAMVDREDDRRLGLKSSAILFGRHDVLAVMVCHAIFLGILAAVGVWAHLGALYFLGIALAVAGVAYQYRLIRGREREKAFQAFLSNNLVGAAIFGGIALDFLLRIPLF
jgi:4-hydroxybenzoate polyprenyltransferase